MMKLLYITLFLSFSLYSQQEDLKPHGEGELFFQYEVFNDTSSRKLGKIREVIRSNPKLKQTFVEIRQIFPNATMIDTLVVGENFTPIRYRSFSKNLQDILVRYENRIKQIEVNYYRKLPQVKDSLFTVNYESEIYDFHWPHLLIGTLPCFNLSEKINKQIYTYQVNSEEVSFECLGKKVIELNGETFITIAWKICSPDSQPQKTFWIDENTRRLVQFRSKLPNGTVWWLKRTRDFH